MGLTVMKMFIHKPTFMVVCLPREKLLLFSAYVNSFLLTAGVEYFAIIGSRLIAECFAFIFQ